MTSRLCSSQNSAPERSATKVTPATFNEQRLAMLVAVLVMVEPKAPTGPREARLDDRLRAVFAPDVPPIHVLASYRQKTWLPGTSPGTTMWKCRRATNAFY